MTLIHCSKTYTNIDYPAENQLSMEFELPDDHQVLAVTAPAKKNNVKNKKIHKFTSTIRSWTTNSMTSNRLSKVAPSPISEFFESCSLESSTYEELTPYSSNNTTKTKLLIQTEISITQNIDLCNEKSVSVIIFVNQKKQPHRNIANAFQKWKKH